MLQSHIQWNLHNKDTIGPLTSEVLHEHMSMQGISNGAEQWCPVKGGGCISEVSLIEASLYIHTVCTVCMYSVYLHTYVHAYCMYICKYVYAHFKCVCTT